MKKLLAAALAGVLAVGAAAPAFAATELTDSPATGKGEGEYSIGVSGTYVPAAAIEPTISVDVAWEKMEFTYTAGKSEYNPSTHITTTAAGKWSTDKKAITVTNHSNIGITAGFTFTPGNGVTTTGSFYDKADATTALTTDKQKLELASGEDTTGATADAASYVTPSGKIYFGVSGDAISEDTTLGTITVKISGKTTDITVFDYDATAVDANTLKAAVASALAKGARKISITLSADAGKEMTTAILEAITEDTNVTDGSIDLTLKGITTIAESAFLVPESQPRANDGVTCTQLKTLTLTDVVEVKKGAFCRCGNLASVTAPKLVSAGKSAFAMCALSEIVFPELTTIEFAAFEGQENSISLIDLPKVTSIAEWAFTESDFTVGAKVKLTGLTADFKEDDVYGGDVYLGDMFSHKQPANIDLILSSCMSGQVTQNADGTATWTYIRASGFTPRSITFKSITFVGD